MDDRPSPAWDLPTSVDTPALLVDVQLMDANLRRMAEALRTRGVDLRPHTKTHKSVQIARRQLQAGAVGLTTATLTEAQVYADAGFDDVFVAYPVWAATPAKIDRVRALGARLRRLLIGIDSVEGARVLARAAADLDGVAAMVEVDSGEGRTGVRHPSDAVAVARAAVDAGLRVVGVFAHGGHSYAGPHASGPAADDEVRTLTAATTMLADSGFEVPVLSAGSTPTAEASARGGVTEERPGTYVFGDRQQSALGAVDPSSIALVVAATVVSRSTGQVVIDAGAKTLSKDKPPVVGGFGALPAYPQATIVRLYDHHGLVDIGGGASPRLGEVVAVIPNHVCPVVNLSDELLIVSEGVVVDRWPVDARTRNR